jgi:hypothetical protein
MVEHQIKATAKSPNSAWWFYQHPMDDVLQADKYAAAVQNTETGANSSAEARFQRGPRPKASHGKRYSAFRFHRC